jgi:short-subunit dehydrogenase
MQLKDAVIILTGASRGIGVAIAEDLAREGCHLVLAARSREKLEEVAGRVRAAGGRATVVPTDVSAPGDREALIDAAEAAGPVVALINNAGIEIPIAVLDLTAEEVQRIIAVNLTAAIELSRLAARRMVPRGRGVIVNLSSMSGKSPTPYNAIYCASKFGLNGFTASLRIELTGTGVSCGVVCPSFVGDAGMWIDSGTPAPSLMPEVPMSRVVAAVRRVMGGAGEVLVTPTPVRPLLALGQMLPGIDRPLLRTMGVLDMMRERADALAREWGRR